jgi:2-polyprenyl-3-methyl-5-hydroxy-6-metoxy-1,4-benzoquinol methylase
MPPLLDFIVPFANEITVKICIAIASYGSKNDLFLQKLIKEYQDMPFQVDIILLSNILKDLGREIAVKVGLPAKNPWSLPFGYKKIFAERLDQYDLFIYSEDDVLITEKNIQAFLEVNQVLPDNEIPGFIRYELSQDGRKYFSTIHSHFHWDPESIKTIKGYTFAYFTNEHSGCHILTRDQLNQAINSGGYLVDPREGGYDMLCTAATDPYTQCGYKKMICISRLDDFSLPHLPNVYVGKLGIESSEVMIQLEALKQIERNEKPNTRLFNTNTRLTHYMWNKDYYEPCRYDIIDTLPKTVRNVLSIGCGWGATEVELLKNRIRVVGIPIDAVIGACAGEKGVEVVYPDFEIARQNLNGEYFDCVLFSEVLHHLPDPVRILSKFTKFLSKNGVVVISAPNFNHISVWGKRFFGKAVFNDFKYIGNYKRSGLHFTTTGKLKQWVRKAGLEPELMDREEVTLTTSMKEESWIWQGGLKPIRLLRKSLNHSNWIFSAAINVLDYFLSSKIIMLGKKR